MIKFLLFFIIFFSVRKILIEIISNKLKKDFKFKKTDSNYDSNYKI